MDKPGRLALRSANRVTSLLTIATAALCLFLITAPAAQAAGAAASGDQSRSSLNLLLRARQLAETVRHQGPVSLLGQAPSGSGGAVAGSTENSSWRLGDKGGAFELTTGVAGSLRTVTILETDVARTRVGQVAGVTAWDLDPARGLRVVDVRHMTVTAHRGRLTTSIAGQSRAGSTPLTAAVPLNCAMYTGAPYISWPYGPFINGYSYVSCETYANIWKIAILVAVYRLQAPWGLINIANGGGVATAPFPCVGSYCFGGAASTPCHVGGQAFFATEAAAVIYSDQPTEIFTDGSPWSVLWCSNPW